MTLDEFVSEIKTDIKIDDTNLHKEAARTPDLFLKYREKFMRLRLRHKKMGATLAQLVSEKRDYYSGKAAPEVYKEKPFDLRLRKFEVDEYIKIDPDVAKIETDIDTLEEMMSFLEDTLKEISRRGFLIKSAIDFRKFLDGM